MQRLLKKLIGGIAAAVVLAGTASRTYAATYTYNQSSRTINAGILLFDSTTPAAAPAAGPENVSPYVFYVFNQRADIKPIGWNLVNPLAPPTVTQDILTRWNARTTYLVGSATASGYTLGQPVTPDMAPYWEVFLDQVTLKQLRKFDILFIGADSTLSLRERDKEALRQYVDAGGQLLVEASYSANPVAAPGNLFFDINTLSTGGTGLNANLLQFNNVPFLHPLVSVPYLMSFELNSLGFGNVKQYVQDASTPSYLSSILFHNDPAQLHPVIATAQLGAGQVIVTSANTASAINDYVGAAGYTGPGANRGPFCGDNLQAASVPDMKLLANMISWSGVQSGEFHDAHNNSFVNEPLAAAVTRTWSYGTTPVAAAANRISMPGAAIFGRYVVTTDVNGVVHCFDAYPRESLNSAGNPDDGTPDFYNGASYDEIWKGALPGRAASPYTSAPTVALVPQGNGIDIPVVFVEAANGQIYTTNLIQSTSPVTWTLVAGSAIAAFTYAGENFSIASRTVPGYAPAPTYYRGILFASDGSARLFTKSYIGGYATAGTYHALSAPNLQYATAPPTVYINESKGTADSRINDITVAVPTNKFINTAYIGTYGDLLGGTAASATSTRIGPLFPSGTYSIDDTSGFSSLFSTIAPYVTPASGTVTPPNAFNITAGSAPFYADYFVNLSAGKPAAMWQAVGMSQTPWTKSGSNIFPYVSAAAVDNNNNQYYTMTLTPSRNRFTVAPFVHPAPHSALACVHIGGDTGQAIAPGNGQMTWRFRMPNQLDGLVVDADGVTYGNPAGGYAGANDASMRLTDFVFSGAPVVDRNGLAYAVGYYMQTSGPAKNQFAVVCFDTNKSVSADISVPAGANPGSVQTPNVVQPVPASAGPTGNNEFGIPLSGTQFASVSQGTNFTADGNGHIVFTNFMSAPIPQAANQQAERYPVLSEPQSVAITFNAVSGGTMTNYSQTVPLHTNLVWMTIGDFGKVGQNSGSYIPNGLTVVGDYAFFGDNIGNRYRAYIHPQADGMVGGDRFVSRTALNHVGIPEVADPEYTGLAGVMSVPSSSNGTMVMSGPNGIVAYQNLRTLGADQDRVFETDADGNLLWAVDGTTKNGVAGGTIGNTGHAIASRMNFRDATAVSQLDANSYLAADTGNNRVVEFDKSGNVINEVTRFSDPNGKMTPGQPDTLNHPTSLVAWRTFSKIDGLGVSTVHYLIADTGNYRVLQVADDFNQAGQVLNVKPHRLEWISHTYDALGRKYAFSGADLFWDTDKQPYVVALVNNTAIAPFTPSLKNQTALPIGQMAPIASDAPGASIVKLDYNTDATHKAGYIHVTSVLVAGKPVNYLNTVSQFLGYTTNISGYPGFDIAKGATDFAVGSQTNARFQLQNARFLHVNTAPGAAPNAVIQGLLVADDNGAFEMYFNGTPFVAPLVAKWGMLQTDYQHMANSGTFVKAFTTDPLPALTPAPVNRRANMRFVPTSVAVVGVDFVGNVPISRYLISQSSGEGDVNAAGDPTDKSYEVAGAPAQKIGGEIFIVAHDAAGNQIYGGYGGATLSRPGNGGALVHPSSASLPVP